ncbi:hypothetical protein K9848_03445 [Latilactobacillus sakei]|uniref:hypothetical protein n=1 Tax=Latilactobacillus sakei TaxID=1599 RepID=UPI0020C7D843|nr:hypothetical protein [Latilactobacillus sakei]MCP8855244.1 hypothetical protein [Latilactobacillus sakei]
MSLITDDFSPALDRTFRLQLIENFKEIKTFIDNYKEDDSPKDVLTSEDLNRLSADLDEKINRLILGIDENTVRIVVEKILQEKGII